MYHPACIFYLEAFWFWCITPQYHYSTFSAHTLNNLCNKYPIRHTYTINITDEDNNNNNNVIDTRLQIHVREHLPIKISRRKWLRSSELVSLAYSENHSLQLFHPTRDLQLQGGQTGAYFHSKNNLITKASMQIGNTSLSTHG